MDELVINIMRQYPACSELTTNIKAELLTIPTIDVKLDGKRSPLAIAVGQTTASLAKCFNGELRRITYPEL